MCFPNWTDTAVHLVIVSAACWNTLASLEYFSGISSVCPPSPAVPPFNWISSTPSSPLSAHDDTHTPEDTRWRLYIAACRCQRGLMLMKLLSHTPPSDLLPNELQRDWLRPVCRCLSVGRRHEDELYSKYKISISIYLSMVQLDSMENVLTMRGLLLAVKHWITE